MSGLYPLASARINSIHGKIPNTYETSKFVRLVIDGTMALHMMGLETIELYEFVLKHMVPDCYDIGELIDNIYRSIINAPIIIRSNKSTSRSKPQPTRKATLADFGLVQSKKKSNKKYDKR